VRELDKDGSSSSSFMHFDQYDYIGPSKPLLRHPKPVKFVSDLLTTDSTTSSRNISPFLVSEDDDYDRRYKSTSPIVTNTSSYAESKTAPSPLTASPSPQQASGSSSSRSRKNSVDDKKKHGSYKIWHRNASDELQLAYNAIYGLPLYGSVVFIGMKPGYYKDFEGEDEIREEEEESCTETIIHKRFLGPAQIVKRIRGTWDVELYSAGKDDGDYARIVINGTDYAENKRGFNLVVLVPETGETKAEAFDTHGLPEEAEKLAAFISSAPAGSFILGAVRDDGAKFLGEIGRAALRLVGVSVPKADDALALQAIVNDLPPDRTRVLLTVCAKANAKHCARVLLNAGWDLHTRASHTLNTPLHDAVYQRNTDVAIVLLDHGADSRLENKWGETPEAIAQKKFGYASLNDMIMSSDAHILSVVRFIGME